MEGGRFFRVGPTGELNRQEGLLERQPDHLFEWDDAKNRRNLSKHKLSFETAILVFDDPCSLSTPDRVVGRPS